MGHILAQNQLNTFCYCVVIGEAGFLLNRCCCSRWNMISYNSVPVGRLSHRFLLFLRFQCSLVACSWKKDFICPCCCIGVHTFSPRRQSCRTGLSMTRSMAQVTGEAICSLHFSLLHLCLSPDPDYIQLDVVVLHVQIEPGIAKYAPALPTHFKWKSKFVGQKNCVYIWLRIQQICTANINRVWYRSTNVVGWGWFVA